MNQTRNCFMAPLHSVVHNDTNNYTVSHCSVCQRVNRLPYLERSVESGAAHLCCISDNLCCSNENGIGHWFWSKGGRFPADWTLIDVLVDWRDNIVGDLCVSSKEKKKRKRNNRCVTQEPYLPRSKFNFEVLITIPCGPCPISLTNLQGFFSPITQHQGYFLQIDVCVWTRSDCYSWLTCVWIKYKGNKVFVGHSIVIC